MDILICGAGIAGLTLAHCLEQHGFRPIVVEKSLHLRDGGYMIDFYGPGYDVAERIELLSELLSIRQDIQQMTFVDAAGRPRFSVPIAALFRLYGDRIINVLRGDLERLIYTRIRDRVEVRFGTEVQACERDAQRVRVTFADGQHEEYDLVIGADGVHSRIRALTFGSEKQFSRFVGYYAAAFILDDPGELAPPAAFYTLTRPRRQVNVYPIRNGRLATLFVHRAELTLGELSRDAILHELHRAYDDIGWIVPELLKRAEQSADLYFDRVEQIELPTWSAGRVTLVGDACGCVSLLGGQGASLAMAGGYLLAEELASGDDPAVALARYETKLKPVVKKAQIGGRRFARWLIPDGRVQIGVRDLMMRLVNTRAAPLLKQQFAFGDSIKF